MNTRLVVIIATTAALGACGSDPANPPQTAPATAAPETASVTQASSGALPTTGVVIDPSIASACGVPQPKAFFEFDSANLQSYDLTALDGVVSCLVSGPLAGKNIELVGRADPRGEDAYNKQLGRSRADSVAGYMATKGMDQAKMAVRSTGEQQATGNDEHGWAFDRRVDIRLAK